MATKCIESSMVELNQNEVGRATLLDFTRRGTALLTALADMGSQSEAHMANALLARLHAGYGAATGRSGSINLLSDDVPNRGDAGVVPHENPTGEQLPHRSQRLGQAVCELEHVEAHWSDQANCAIPKAWTATLTNGPELGLGQLDFPQSFRWHNKEGAREQLVQELRAAGYEGKIHWNEG